MTPWETLESKYEKERGKSPADFPLNFDAMFRLHAKRGFAYSTPDFIIYGRPVDSEAEPEHITEPAHEFPRDKCDCWMIHGMSGDMRKAWAVLPFELPLICFERERDGRELCVYSLPELRRLTSFDAHLL